MHRYTFYLLVALLAFGTGSFVVFKFYLNIENASSRIEEQSETNITERLGDIRSDIKKRVLETPLEITFPSEKKTVFSCSDKILSAVLRDLRKETWFIEESKYTLEEENLSNCNDILFIEELIDLNNDGKKEAIVRGKTSLFCGATGNCSTWIYEKSGKIYRKLLRTGGETLEVKKNSTNGYKNIFVSIHQSCCSSNQKTYKFDRSRYKESKCLFVDFGTTGEEVVTTCAEETARIEKESRQSKISIGKQ